MGVSLTSRGIAGRHRKPIDVQPPSVKGKADLTQPLELRQTSREKTKPQIPDIVRTTSEQKKPSVDHNREGEPAKDYKSALEDFAQAITGFTTFREQHHTTFLDAESKLHTLLASPQDMLTDPSIHRQLEEHLDRLIDYQQTVFDQYQDLQAKKATMLAAKKAYDRTESGSPDAKHFNTQYKKHQQSFQDLRSFSSYNDRLTRHIAITRICRDVIQQYTEIAGHNQSLAERLGPLADPQSEAYIRSSQEIHVLMANLNGLNNKYGIETVSTTFMRLGNNSRLKSSFYARKIGILEDKRRELKLANSDKHEQLDREFDTAVTWVKQLQDLHRESDSYLFIKKYDSLDMDIKQQAIRIRAFNKTMNNAWDKLEHQHTQFPPWNNEGTPSITTRETLNELVDQQTREFITYYQSRMIINEINRQNYEFESMRTLDGFIGWHQVKRNETTRHHSDLYSQLGPTSCGHVATLTTAEIFGANLYNPAVVTNILQRFPDKSRHEKGLYGKQIRDAFNSFDYITKKYKSRFIPKTLDLELEHMGEETILEKVRHYTHQIVETTTGEFIYAPVVFAVERDSQKETHWVILHAIGPTDDVEYYSNDIRTITNLRDVIELVKDEVPTLEIIAP